MTGSRKWPREAVDGGLTTRVLTGRDAELKTRVADLARLRITVFREYPYLYDGTLEYEEQYLATYLNCPESVVVLALDGAEVVGASTGVPLEYETEEFQRPFLSQGYQPQEVFYCGESVLLRSHRGRGVYGKFFAGREGHARALGRFDFICHCAVERPADDPRRPADYLPMDAVWQKFGYTKHPELHTSYAWKDLDEPAATAKRMVFWVKRI